MDSIHWNEKQLISPILCCLVSFQSVPSHPRHISFPPVSPCRASSPLMSHPLASRPPSNLVSWSCISSCTPFHLMFPVLSHFPHPVSLPPSLVPPISYCLIPPILSCSSHLVSFLLSHLIPHLVSFLPSCDSRLIPYLVSSSCNILSSYEHH